MSQSVVSPSTVTDDHSLEVLHLHAREADSRQPKRLHPKFFEATSFPKVDTLPDSSNPYEVAVGLEHDPRPGMTFGQILGGIVFGAISAVTAFVATCLIGLPLVVPLVGWLGVGSKISGWTFLLIVVAFACVVSAVTFIKVFRGARSSQKRRPAADKLRHNSWKHRSEGIEESET